MNHQPFENWLLDDEPLTVPQKRELQIHVRGCRSCAAIAESNLALHSTHAISPRPGFTERFSTRLARWKHVQHRRQILGTLVLVLGAVALLYFSAAPAIAEAARSPAEWLAAIAAFLIMISTLLSVFGEVGGILVRGLASFVPPAGWLALAVTACGLGVIWMLTMRRLAKAPKESR
jgi:hypothetical protein